MAREIKCPSCKKWNTDARDNCSYCGSVLDMNIFRKIESEKLRPTLKQRIKEKPGWLERFLDKTEKSKNPFVVLIRTLLYYTWLAYMGFVMFFAWLIFWASG